MNDAYPPRGDRRHDDENDFRAQRRNGRTPEESSGVWIRWGIGVMLMMALGSLGFVINMAMAQARMEGARSEADRQALEQRALTNSKITELGTRVSSMDDAINKLREQIRELSPPSRNQVPSRMFDR